MINLAERPPLVLSVKRGKWRDKAGIEPADQEFQAVKHKALAKDANTCIYCGYRALKGMEVHHRNDDHADNRIINLATTCPLCHAVNHIGFLGKSGIMVYLPEISQADISHLYRAIGIALYSQDESMREAAFAICNELESFSSEFYAQWKTHNPADIGNALMALTDPMYEVRDGPLAGSRVIFKKEALKRHVEIAEAGPYKNLPLSSWESIGDRYLNLSDQELNSYREAGNEARQHMIDQLNKKKERE